MRAVSVSPVGSTRLRHTHAPQIIRAGETLRMQCEDVRLRGLDVYFRAKLRGTWVNCLVTRPGDVLALRDEFGLVFASRSPHDREIRIARV